MKIGIVLPNTPSYSETFFNAKIKKLQESNHEVILFAHKEKNYTQSTVIEPLPQNIIGIVKFCCIVICHFSKLSKCYNEEVKTRGDKTRALKNTFLNAHMLQKKLDWLHFGYATTALNRENVARCIGAKMGVSFRGYDLNVYPLQNKTCYKVLFEKVDKVHSVSNYLLKKAHTLGLSKSKPHQIIYDAVAQKHIENETTVVRFVNEHKATFNIVSIARLNWIKGVQYAIQAMTELKKNQCSFQYRIIGGGTKHELEYMNFLIQENNLENEVILEGELSHNQALEILKSADVYLQPSIGEGFCTSVVEAQALGKVCVVSDAGGLPENVVDGVTGWVVPKCNPLAIADKLQNYWSIENTKKIQMSMNGIDRVRQLFTTEEQLQHFINFYSDNTI